MSIIISIKHAVYRELLLLRWTTVRSGTMLSHFYNCLIIHTTFGYSLSVLFITHTKIPQGSLLWPAHTHTTSSILMLCSQTNTRVGIFSLFADLQEEKKKLPKLSSFTQLNYYYIHDNNFNLKCIFTQYMYQCYLRILKILLMLLIARNILIILIFYYLFTNFLGDVVIFINIFK